MALIKGIHHIALKCRGTEHFLRTVAFYKDILGIPVARSWGEGDDRAVMLDTGSGILEIFANASDMPEEGALRHMAFAVDDTDLCIEKVRAAGYTVTMEPTDIVIAGDYPARIAFCIGPVGESVEFFCEK